MVKLYLPPREQRTWRDYGEAAWFLATQPYWVPRMWTIRTWDNLNRKANQQVRWWLTRYFTPFEGERVDSCSTDFAKRPGIVKSVDVRGDEVKLTHGGTDSLRNCVDEYGWREKYISWQWDENGERKDITNDDHWPSRR